MTRDETQLLLNDVEQAQRQLTNIAARLKLTLGGHQTGTATKKPYRHPAASEAARNHDQRPDGGKLAAFPCPKCRAPMHWQWSHISSAWFAGCSKFKKDDCRGSRPFYKVMGTTPEPAAEPAHVAPHSDADAPPLGSNPPWADAVEAPSPDDIERIDKHHGEGAAADEFADGKIPF